MNTWIYWDITDIVKLYDISHAYSWYDYVDKGYKLFTQDEKSWDLDKNLNCQVINCFASIMCKLGIRS